MAVHCSIPGCFKVFYSQRDYNYHLTAGHIRQRADLRSQILLQIAGESNAVPSSIESANLLRFAPEVTYPSFDDRYEPLSDQDDSDSESEEEAPEAETAGNLIEDANTSEEELLDPIGLFDDVHSDKERPDHPWHPFATKEDFWFAWWSRMTPSLSKSRINEFLRVIRDLSFSMQNITFSSAQVLDRKVDELAVIEHIVPWQQHSIVITGSEIERLNGETVPFFYRDTLEVVRTLFSRGDLDICLRPKREYDEGRSRVYNEAWTGERWWELQVSVY